MSFTIFYSAILARSRPGSPTVEEARRDFRVLLQARLTRLAYV